MAQRVGLVKKWPFVPIFGQTGGYNSPFGQCDMALSCPDQVYYLLGRNWDSTWPDRVGKIVIILATVKSESTKLVSRNPEFRIRDSATWAQSRKINTNKTPYGHISSQVG